MASDYQVASILADNMNVNPRTGNQYTATYSKEEFDADKSGDVILMENRNGSGVITPKFKEEQIKDAEAYIKSQMTSYIDKKTENRTFTEPGVEYAPQYLYEAGKGSKTAKEEGNMIAKLYSGDAGEIQAAVDHFNGLSDVSFVSRTPDGISVTLTNGDIKPIRFKNPNGTMVSQADFVRSASSLLLGNNADINDVLKGAVGTSGKSFNNEVSASAATQRNEPPKPLTPQQKAKNYLTKAITPAMVNQEEEVAVPQILNAITKLGFTATESSPGSNYVEITAPGKDGATQEFKLKVGAGSASVAKSIVDFVTANLDQKTLINADRSGALGGSSTMKAGNKR
jgi:hypothetical protein